VQHVPELGIRIALGASTSDILRLVLRRGMTLAIAGIATGALAALATTRLMSSLLYGFSGTGAMMAVVAGAILLVLAFVATYLPARRATRLNPIAALRAD
jgi:ABC-type antimicrobial peptide transport system permease subunit